jgi:hypothetical protein
MNAKEEYDAVNTMLRELARQPPFEMPDNGTDREKVEYLLDQYARRLKKNFWRYRIYWNNRKIPEMICMYLAKILDEDEKKAEPAVSGYRATRSA